MVADELKLQAVDIVHPYTSAGSVVVLHDIRKRLSISRFKHMGY